MNRNAWRKPVLIGVVSAALILGGAWIGGESATAAWTHGVSNGYDVWSWDGAQKLRWQLSNGQWGHYSTFGSTWWAISATGRPSTFIGGGGWYDLGNGFTYQFTSAYDAAYFKHNGAYRFRYVYGTGRWCHTGNTFSWQPLEETGLHLDAGFVGNGGWWALGNGITYQYSQAYDVGYFKDATSYRFRYKYGTGRWENTANTVSWQLLGQADVPRNAGFLGNGAWWVLGNGFTYQYCAPSDNAYFRVAGTSTYRYRYTYGAGQWAHTGNTLSWQPLGSAGISASFMGDGVAHDLGTWYARHWWYTSDTANQAGQFALNTATNWRFAYKYHYGHWDHWDQNRRWWLGISGPWYVTIAFIGDGTYHQFFGSDSTWELKLISDNRLVIRQTGTTNDWLAYDFSGPYWMDRANGYAWTPILSATSGPYWLYSAEYYELVFKTNSPGSYKLDYVTGYYWAGWEYYYTGGAHNLARYNQYSNQWDQWDSSSHNWVSWETGGPGLHRP